MGISPISLPVELANRDVLHPRAMRHMESPHNVGPDPQATHYGAGGVPGAGPYIELWLRIEGDMIVSASYGCNGCPSSTACGSVVAEVVTGKTREVASRLNEDDVIVLLGGLPDGKGYYAGLATSALRNAMENKIDA